MLENLKSAEKKIEHKENVQLRFTTDTHNTKTGTPEPFRKKMQTWNRGMVSIHPDEEVTT